MDGSIASLASTPSLYPLRKSSKLRSYLRALSTDRPVGLLFCGQRPSLRIQPTSKAFDTTNRHPGLNVLRLEASMLAIHQALHAATICPASTVHEWSRISRVLPFWKRLQYWQIYLYLASRDISPPGFAIVPEAYVVPSLGAPSY